jgi:hypothetical protein
MDYPNHSLDGLWFYLDEYSTSRTRVTGPVSRTELINKLKVFLASFGESSVHLELLVWHPIFTKNWLSHEKVKRYIYREETTPVQQLYDECAKMKYIADHPKPNYRGFMMVSFNNARPGKKWVVLVGSKIHVCGTNTVQRIDYTIPIQEIEFKICEKNPSKDIFIRASSY